MPPARTGKSAVSTPLDASMRIVVLCGKESFLIEEHAGALAEALKDAYSDFERFSFDGETVEAASVLDELRSYGLMQQHKLVVVIAADAFMAREGNRPLMERYAAAPVDHATLLLKAEGWRPGRFDKAAKKVGAIIRCDPFNDPKAVSWSIARSHDRYGTEIERAAASALVERLGTDLTRLDAELDKLSTIVGPGSKITRADVAELVGRSREEQAWDVQKAVLAGDPGAALAKLRELLDISRAPYELLQWSLTDLVRKLHAASHLISSGHPPYAVRKEAKLWGDSAEAMLKTARRLRPHRLAQLLREAIEADARTKSGLAEGTRSLEGLTVRLTDSLR